MTWLTVMEHLRYKWRQICYTCRKLLRPFPIHDVVQRDFSTCVTWRVFYKKQELLTLGFFGGVCVAHLFWSTVLCCVFVLFVFFLNLVWPILPVFRDCPFLIVSSGFSNVYSDAEFAKMYWWSHHLWVIIYVCCIVLCILNLFYHM